jgi:uncharacterized protein YoaH (UPF0181 family)
MRLWEMLGMSRAAWYRHGKPTEKPKRYSQADIARILGISVRTLQRDVASEREKNRQKVVARARELIAQGRDQDEAIATAMAEVAAEERQLAENQKERLKRPRTLADEWLQRRIEMVDQTKTREKP